MAKVFDGIDERLVGWIARQPMFFVATAPLAADGRVNLSPKGPMGTFGVLGPRRVAYLDLVGSGAETVAHLRENGRVVVMLCAFEGSPRIVRLHGRGEVVLPDDPRFVPLLEELAPRETTPPQSRRAVVVVDVEHVSDSCGYTVPLMDYVGERPHLGLWADKKLRTQGPDALERYKVQENARSLDGLPALSG